MAALISNNQATTFHLTETYNKIIATIESCKTEEQLEGASRMVENFKRIYKRVGYPKILLYKINITLNKQLKCIGVL